MKLPDLVVWLQPYALTEKLKRKCPVDTFLKHQIENL